LIVSLAVVCLSGGLDSCVTLATALREHDEIAALHFSYGQRTQEREHRAFEEICQHYKVQRRLHAKQPALAQIGGSALTDSALEIPGDAPESAPAPKEDEVPITYVPFRNGQILALACAWAETLRARAVYLGAVEEDSSGYPDCREAFFTAFASAVEAGTRPDTHIQIATPLLHLRKGEIVKRGLQLGAPLHLSWSCYSNSRKACGRCESCRLRLKGFAEADAVDPIPYETR
jgi:7-cyano-7-deazaguanine synthase